MPVREPAGNDRGHLRLKAWGNKIERAWRNAVKELITHDLDHAPFRRQLISGLAGLGMSTVAVKVLAQSPRPNP